MELAIKKYCLISGGSVVMDGREIFSQPGATAKELLTALYRHMGVDYPKFFKMDMLSRAGFMAAELIMPSEKDGQRTGLLLTNSSSSLDTDRNYQQTIGAEYFPSPAVFVYTLPNIVLGEISIRHKLYGENLFMVTPEFDAEQIYNQTALMLGSGIIDGIMSGWVECNAEKCDIFCMFVGRAENENEKIFNVKNIRACL